MPFCFFYDDRDRRKNEHKVYKILYSDFAVNLKSHSVLIAVYKVEESSKGWKKSLTTVLFYISIGCTMTFTKSAHFSERIFLKHYAFGKFSLSGCVILYKASGNSVHNIKFYCLPKRIVKVLLRKRMVRLKGTCVLFRTHSISEVKLFRETNYDAGTFNEIFYI